MHEGIMDFLFDSGQHFQESWEMHASSPEDAMKRLNRIAQARLGLLASSVRIVRLRVKGQPMQRKFWKGIAGSFAWPRHVLLLRDDGWATKKRLRGVPKEIFDKDQITPRGRNALANYSNILRECGIILRQDKPELVAQLQVSRMALFSYKLDKPAPLRKLAPLLGQDEANRFWAVLKEKKAKESARFHPGAAAS
jgi:hypothetical protein